MKRQTKLKSKCCIFDQAAICTFCGISHFKSDGVIMRNPNLEITEYVNVIQANTNKCDEYSVTISGFSPITGRVCGGARGTS